MRKKYSILLPYYKRLSQFRMVLASFRDHYSERKDFEIIVAIDSKNDEEEISKLNELMDEHKEFSFCSFIVESENCFSPVILFNKAFEKAKGKYIVISNPEIFHRTNILAGFDKYILENGNSYIVCACFNNYTLENRDFIPNQDIWYQHSIHNNRNLHFCSCISKANWKLIGGFDENYSKGIGFDDDDFRDAVIKNNMPIISDDSLLTFHLEHSREYQEKHKELWDINKTYYMNKWGK